MKNKTAETWEALRGWIESPPPGAAPTTTRLQFYKLLPMLRAVGCTSMVRRYLCRTPHRGKPAAPPSKGQLLKLLPLVEDAGFRGPYYFHLYHAPGDAELSPEERRQLAAEMLQRQLAD